MKLKKLELLGFKSFADKTEVIFDQGVTCVVGPNGCGKSNISDAIRWVLGERSAKMLRGSKMEDIIFNGTDFRKPLSFAEVALTIDNTDRGLPIDYSEVTIARRLYRSGESEYLINKTVVRLKDVQDLILDTGIGSSSYSMIEQGRIDYILNADAEERRFLIEEAAGISKYKVKKEEALRKLERTEQNLQRLNDIVQEVHKNIQYAERQAKRAEKYKEQFIVLKDLETRKAFYDLKLLSNQKLECENQKKNAEDELGRLEQEILNHQTQITRLEEELRRLGEKQSAKESERYAILSQTEKNEQQLRFHQEKRMEMAVRRGEIQQEIAQLTERVEKSVSEVDAKKKDQLRFQEEQGRISGELARSENYLAEAQQGLEQVKSRLEKSKSEAFELASELTKLRNEHHRIQAFLESAQRQKDKMLANRSRFENDHAEWRMKKDDCENEMRTAAEKVHEFEEAVKRIETQIEETKDQLESFQKQNEELRQLLHEKESRLTFLKEMDAAGGSNVEAVLADLTELEKAWIHNMREIVKVKEGYDWAAEAALGFLAKYLVVDNFETAEKVYEYMSSLENAEIGFLVNTESPLMVPQEEVPGPQHPALECSIADVLEIKEEYQKLIRPLLTKIYVARDLNKDVFRQLLDLSWDCCIVTRQGICLGPSGRVYLKSNPQDDQSHFHRGKEIKSLEAELEEIRQKTDALQNQKVLLQAKLKEREAARQAAGQEWMDLKIQKESLDSVRGGMSERLTSYQKELDLVWQDIQELERQCEEAVQKKNALDTELQAAGEKEKEHRAQEESLIRELEAKDQEKTQALKMVAENQSRHHHLQEQSRLLEEALGILIEHEDRDRKRIDSLRDETEKIGQKESLIDEEDIRIADNHKILNESLRQVDVELEVMKQDRQVREEASACAQETVQGIRARQQKVQESLHKIEMGVMDVSYQEKAIHERLDQTYHIRLSELKPEDFEWQDRNLEEVNAEIEKLKGRVDSMGTVNMLAIEEYDELKQRYDFLATQKKDLEDARESLLEAIRKINRTTKSLFEETFTNVQIKFREYYQILFRGGEAKLVLVDETHPLESGIDIVVRPPGKRPQHMTLLSGGEKALTAIALLFALFKIKPSPFCVLDEVDAPLDEANIDRFLTVLRTFLEVTQFIIVTHNRKTIAMGDSLYGVTMQEAGISKIVSVRVNNEEDDKGSKNTAAPEDDAIEDSVVA